ncbi:histidine phosphatase family protein [Donghicola sp. C2-DW-16]|uniref:Histidine phosphatase family protein n=1 Tax=Donghicola mangrovi TaxID=2729614 RepID=A0ABX2PDF5_9RHOB|nr:histidine phosphatase family protein [Donghicola mangrovi]NVO26991.1 histidine phosphatase family protein [Donghicola mangrovi]
MPLPDLYILRHGETVANAEGRMQGGLDSPLTAKGLAQAEAMAELLRGQGLIAGEFDLFSSPQGRALQTAAPIAQALGAEVQPEPRIAEIGMGQWAGLLLSEIAERWPAPTENESVLDFYARAPEGERFDSLWVRTGAFLNSLTRPAVIVTHGFTSRFLRTQVMGCGMDRLGDVPDGQGVIFAFRDGQQTILK